MRQFNVIVLGVRSTSVRGTGLTLLPARFVRDVYVENYDPLYFCVEQYLRPMMVDDERSSLEILDTTGAEQFTSLIELYIKIGRGFVLVFRQAAILAQRSSLEQVKNLRKQIYRIKGSETLNDFQVPIVVAATESDHGSEREVSASTLESLANEWNIPFYETSAKHNLNVNDVFEDLLRQIRVRYPPDARRKQKQPQGPCTIM
ncbi:small GTPase superfamily [Mycena olivaceomarginata]|nr:small GTPase superfamily [Mycena olivaceomarginata]